MNDSASNGPGGIWNPPAPSTGRARRSWQRTLSIGAVIAVHIVLVVYLAARPLGWRLPGMGPAEDPNVVYLDPELTSPDAVNDPAGRSRDPADLLESEAARRPRGDFIPPRLVRSSVRDPAAYAERAGIRSGESARVVLAVNVTEQGVAGDISVSATSGSAQADAAAIEYARTLRWAPAQDKGRESSASIRLPVVLALSN